MLQRGLLRLLLGCLISMSIGEGALTFPKNFKFGVATSSYQIEGGYNEDGKGVSNWDRITNQVPNIVTDQSNGNIACDSYHKWQEDIDNLVHLGVQYYRFSLAWTRILPGGYNNVVNQAGVDYYNNLINGLLAKNIQPVVTIYHWDMPQKISTLGGVANSAYIDYFVNYARVAFDLFGDRVKLWITFNEPNIICDYFPKILGSFTPDYPNGIIEYLNSYNLLRAHAEVYHLYARKYRAKQKGRVGITLNFEWAEPLTQKPEDVAAAERRRQFDFGRFANPILKFDTPDVVVGRVKERSTIEGFDKSRLPAFTLEEKIRIRGTADFLGLNYYTTWKVADGPEAPSNQSSFEIDTRVVRSKDPTWATTASPDNTVNPEGLRTLLNWIKDTYNNPEIIITECGFSDSTGTLEDVERIRNYQGYLQAVLQAIREDDVNISGFIAWSLMDNFEWTAGYTSKFGLYQVDFNDPDRKRTPKASAEYFKGVVANRTLPNL